MFENPRRGREARNFTTNGPKILDLKSSSEQIFYRKLPLGAPVSGQEYCTKLKWEHEELTDILISFPGNVEGFITLVSSFGLSSFSFFNTSFILSLKVSSSRFLGPCGIFKYYLIFFRSCIRRSCFVTFLTGRHTDACQPWCHFLFYKIRYYQALFIG